MKLIKLTSLADTVIYINTARILAVERMVETPKEQEPYLAYTLIAFGQNQAAKVKESLEEVLAIIKAAQ